VAVVVPANIVTTTARVALVAVAVAQPVIVVPLLAEEFGLIYKAYWGKDLLAVPVGAGTILVVVAVPGAQVLIVPATVATVY
jgi:hypothetical protein